MNTKRFIVLTTFLIINFTLISNKIFSGNIIPFVYNENFITYYNQSLNKAETFTPQFQNYVISPVKQDLITTLNRDYELARSIRVNDKFYGMLFKFDKNGVFESVQLSLHESKVIEYERFLRIMAELFQVDYNEFLINAGFTDKVTIAETNLRASRLASSSYKKLIGGYVYSHTYNQNKLFDVTIERKTKDYGTPYTP